MESVPFVSGSTTSEEAALSIGSKAATLREKVYEALKTLGPMIDEEIQDLLEMNPSTERPRRIELCSEGRVIDSGSTGLTKSGRKAVLWKAL